MPNLASLAAEGHTRRRAGEAPVAAGHRRLTTHRKDAMRETSHSRLRAALPLAIKVPEITFIFWVLKLLTTGMGEAMSDFMGQHSVPIAGAVGILGLTVALWWQFRSPEYRAVTYWVAVLMVAV